MLITAHDAFGYFCITYDIESMPLGGVSTEEEVSIGRMDEVINYLVEHKISTLSKAVRQLVAAGRALEQVRDL